MNKQTRHSQNEVIICLNPNAGARSRMSRIQRLQRLLSAEKFSSQIITDIREMAERAEQLQGQNRLRCVVAAGGDGTASMVVNKTLPGTPVAIMPLGTENLLAKYLGIRPTVESVFDAVAHGVAAKMDAGRVGNQIFLLMLTCGFDADVVHRLHDARNGHIHHLTYLKPICESVRKYQYPEISVSLNGDKGEIKSRWAFVFNLPCYAMGLPIAPDARGNDGLLDVCTFRRGSMASTCLYLGAVLTRQHAKFRDCKLGRSNRIVLESAEAVPYALDGDPGGFLPVNIESVPNRLTLLVRRQWAIRRGFSEKSLGLSKQ